MPKRTQDSPKRKLTLRLPEDIWETTREAVELGLAPSVTSFFEDSIRARSREVRHARLRQQAAEAMADPDFVADMRATMDAFEPALLDRWPVYDDTPRRSPRDEAAGK
ncbi:MAG: hypothetical protein ACLQVD_00505 [Capsulimonadaceae bacterium]